MNEAPSPKAHDALERLSQAEHDLEARLGAALIRAEQSLARRFGVGCLRALERTVKLAGVLALMAYFTFGVALLVVRHAVLPRIDEYRAPIEALAAQALDAQVRIGRIEGDWQGFNPHLKLSDVRLARATASGEKAQDTLVLPQIDATLSWSTLWRLTPRFHELSVLAPELEVRRESTGRWLIGGFVLDPNAARTDADTRALEWALGQRRISIRDARVRFVDETARNAQGEARELRLEDVQIRADAGWRHNRFALRATPPTELSSPIDVRAAIEHPLFEPASRVALWSGRVFAQADFVDLAQVRSLLGWLPGGMRLEAAQGALRTWVDFDRMAVQRVTSDLALADVNVVLGPDLAPLALESARGRLAYREFSAQEGFSTQEGAGLELTLDGFSMTGRALGVALPPTRLRLQLNPPTATQSRRGQFEASMISLDQLSALAAHVPLGREVRALVARHAVGGELTALAAQWEGEFDFDAQTNTLRHLPTRYQVATRFAQLSSVAVAAEPALDAQGHARAGLPGFQNLAGELNVNAQGGTLRLDAHQATLEFPGVFEAPRKHFARIHGAVQWTATSGQALEVQLQQLTLMNEAVQLVLDGTYRPGGKGAGLVDISGRIDSAAAAQVHEYLPLTVGTEVRTWLRNALLAGSATEGSLRLRGDLADFPFTDSHSGEFRVSTRLREGTLDFAPALSAAHRLESEAPHWPVLDGIEADVLFERNRMLIVAQQARARGVSLTEVTAQIPNLGAADAQLQVSGKLRGALEPTLLTVARSPVGALLGDVLGRAKASGEVQGELGLNIPLGADPHPVQVKGAVTLKNNDIALRILPPITQTSGRVEFTDRSLKLTAVRGQFLGGALQLNADTQPDGAIVFKATGSATPVGARALTDTAALQSALDRATGSARYNATVTVRNARPDLRIESDLVGWAVDLPAPLGKLAATALPLRVLLTAHPTQPLQDRLQINVGGLLAARLEREGSATDPQPRIVRGAVRITDEATTEPPVVPTQGIRLDVALNRLDLDRWALVAYGATQIGNVARPQAEPSTLPDTISARVRELRIAGKPIANVVLGASRATNGAQQGSWQVNLESDQASGALVLQPGQGGQEARVNARLARLTIPEAQRGEIAELLDAPLQEMPALDVVADNFELGARKLGRLELQAHNQARSWKLQKLDITNPDGKFSAQGEWSRDPKTAGARRMALTFGLDFSNGGALLARLNYPGALRASAGRLEGAIHWRGSPFALDAATLGGELRLNAEKGQFLKADAGAGRLLGVMSLQSLPRRLTLDFRDVFSEGFAFDTLRASAAIDGGVLTTRDLRMRSVAATVLMEGSVDLAKETQNLHVLVLPEINAGSASLLYAALANPAIGIGTFLAQLVLRDPLSKAFSFEYDVTGSWAEPQVKRREKAPAPETSTQPQSP